MPITMLNRAPQRPWQVLALALLAAAMGSPVEAEIRVPGIFSDNMVIQSGMPFVIHGAASEGEQAVIEVSWGQPPQTVTGDALGRWLATFAPPAAPGPHEITIRGQNTISIKNILCGEVWLCAGQSNMAMQMAYKNKDNRGVLNQEAEIRRANYPELRYFLVSREKNSSSASNLTDVEGEWKICTPDAAGDFSGVAYYFGERLHLALRRPVGLIDNSWGGTYIQSWMSPAALETDPDFAAHLAWASKGMEELPAEQKKYEERLQSWREQGAKPESKPSPPYWHKGHRNIPSGLYHARVAPLFPTAIQGVLWYQGEANAPKAWLYQRLLPAMIRDWRNGWGRADLPFFVVQLPLNFNPGESAKTHEPSAWAELREAQFLTAKSTPHVALTVALDAGEGHIHPRNKRPVGERLALAALAKVYRQSLVWSGPLYSGVTIEGDKVIVRFSEIATGLRTTDRQKVRGVVLAGEDRQFHPAEARIVGDTLVVQSAEVRAPVAVRYAWATYPDGNLSNREGLPAAPFRSDSWPESTFGLK
jgi:sialate O-acetylesterase